MFRALQTFLRDDAPTRRQAVGALRTLFALAFAGQTGLALAAWGVLLLVYTPEPTGPLTAQVLVGMAGLELPFALILGALSARSGKQAGALSAALLQGVVLSSPVWFALFAWLIGSPVLYPALLLGVSALFYALGLPLVGRYAAQATVKGARAIKPSF